MGGCASAPEEQDAPVQSKEAVKDGHSKNSSDGSLDGTFKVNDPNLGGAQAGKGGKLKEQELQQKNKDSNDSLGEFNVTQ